MNVIEGSCLRIYLTESDRIDGRPAIEAILELCRQCGLRGVTVLRGIEGLGSHGIHSTSFLSLSNDLPLVLEAIDTPERMTEAIKQMRPHLGNQLVATWPVSLLKSEPGESHD
jgi:hypothetical protein